MAYKYKVLPSAEAVDRRLSLIDENKNLLKYPYIKALPGGFTNVGDGSILTSGAYGRQSFELNDCLLDAGTYIVSLAITDIIEEPTIMTGFSLKVVDKNTNKDYTKTATPSNDDKKTFYTFTLDTESTVVVSLEIPDNVITGLLIRPQLEKYTDDGQPSDWVPNMDKIGTYVDRRFNGANAKIKVLDDNIEDVRHEISALNNKFKISGTVTKAIGGIAKDKVYSNAELSTVLSDLLFPYVAPTFNSITLYAAAGTFEYGTTKTVSKVTPDFTKGSKNITSVKIGTTSGGSDLYSGTSITSGTAITLTTSKTYNGDTGGTIYCTINDGTTSVEKSATISYTYYTYAIASTNSSITSITSGAKKASTSSTSAEISLSPDTDSYIWFLLPPGTSGSKTIQYEALGNWYEFTGGTADPVDVSLKLNSGSTVTYKGYRTNKKAAAGTTKFKIV